VLIGYPVRLTRRHASYPRGLWIRRVRRPEVSGLSLGPGGDLELTRTDGQVEVLRGTRHLQRDDLEEAVEQFMAALEG